MESLDIVIIQFLVVDTWVGQDVINDTPIGREAGDDTLLSRTPSPTHARSPSHGDENRSPSHDDEKPVSPPVVAPVATPARARKAPPKVSKKKPQAKGKAASKKPNMQKKAESKAKVKQVKAKEATAEKKQATKIKDDIEKKLHSVPKLKHIQTTFFFDKPLSTQCQVCSKQNSLTMWSLFLLLSSQVYSVAHSTAKAKGKSAEECKRMAAEARLKYLNSTLGYEWI